MSIKDRLYKSFGSLVDICPTPERTNIMRHDISLKYDLMSSDVESAWADVICKVGDSYLNIIEESYTNEKKLESCKFIERYQRERDISKSISLDDLLEEIEKFNDSNTSHRRLNRELKVSYDRA